jgi:HlyD family secretion protein
MSTCSRAPRTPQTFDKREVKIGLSDGINIELTEGVTADDKVRGAKEDKKK